MYTQNRFVLVVLNIVGIYTGLGGMDPRCTATLFIENKSGWALTIIYTNQAGDRVEEPMRQGEKFKELICVDMIRSLSFVRRGQVWGFGASEISLNDQLVKIRQKLLAGARRGQDPVIVITATTMTWKLDIAWQATVQGSLVMPEELLSDSAVLGRSSSALTSSKQLSMSQIMAQYKDLWRLVNVPDAYKRIVLDYANREQALSLKDAMSGDPIKARTFVWGAVGDQFGLLLAKDPLASGLWFWNAQADLFKGDRALTDQLASFVFKDFYRAAGTHREKQIMEKLVDDYKIHLMPVGDMTPTLIKLFEVIQKNPQIQKDIWSVKCNSRYDDEQLKRVGSGSPDARPKIVIYPASGKEAAQRVLDLLYAQFQHDPGLGIAPRFNKRVTNLIYISQGNGDDKVGSNLEYFQEPDYVYFNTKKVAEILDVNPSTLNFELNIPK